MNIGKARALFEQIASREYHGSTVGEYLEAVKIVLDMETHNSISKKMIISVCKWLVEIAEKAVSPYRWIPCSERMPEESEYYIITANDGVGHRTTFAKFQKKAKSWDLTGARSYWRVIAWMPLPKPFEGGTA